MFSITSSADLGMDPQREADDLGLDRWMQTEVTSGSDGGRSKERKSFL
jgi:hypothetical protein